MNSTSSSKWVSMREIIHGKDGKAPEHQSQTKTTAGPLTTLSRMRKQQWIHWSGGRGSREQQGTATLAFKWNRQVEIKEIPAQDKHSAAEVTFHTLNSLSFSYETCKPRLRDSCLEIGSVKDDESSYLTAKSLSQSWLFPPCLFYLVGMLRMDCWLLNVVYYLAGYAELLFWTASEFLAFWWEI